MVTPTAGAAPVTHASCLDLESLARPYKAPAASGGGGAAAGVASAQGGLVSSAGVTSEVEVEGLARRPRTEEQEQGRRRRRARSSTFGARVRRRRPWCRAWLPAKPKPRGRGEARGP